jgi:glycosyltransferase involved in cell wall biosynthesis
MTAALRATYDLPDHYVYYVGGYDERKNIPTLLRAYAALPEALRTQFPLVLAGRAAGSNPTLFPDIDGLITQLGIGSTVRRIDVPRTDNPALYSGATCFVYPSCDEGFGLPPLEAMACGTAVIAARAASIPEGVGAAAHLVDPVDVAGWTAALLAVLTDNDLRNRLQRAGTERAGQFSYGQTAAATRAVYLRALGREGDA